MAREIHFYFGGHLVDIQFFRYSLFDHKNTLSSCKCTREVEKYTKSHMTITNTFIKEIVYADDWNPSAVKAKITIFCLRIIQSLLLARE
jgi:hypothetical protein